MDKKKITIIACAVVTVILIVILLASCKKEQELTPIDDLIKKPEVSSSTTSLEIETSVITEPKEPDKEESIFTIVNNIDRGYGSYYIYKDTEENFFVSKTYDIENEETILVKQYYCQSVNCLITTMNSNRYVLIYEDYIYLYDFLNNKQMMLNMAERIISKVSTEFKARFIYRGTSPIIISLYSKRTSGEKDSLLYLISNNNILFSSDTYLDQSSYYPINSTIKDGCIIRSASTGKILFNPGIERSDCDMTIKEVGNTIYYFLKKEDKTIDVYNSNLSKMKTITSSTVYEIESTGNFVIAEEGSIKSYNTNGGLINSTEPYDKVFLLDRVGVVLDNGMVKIVDYKGEQLVELMAWKSGMTFSKYSKTKVYNEMDIIHVILKKGTTRYEFLYEFDTKRLGKAVIKK